MSGVLRELEEVAYARLLSLVGELQGPGLGGGEQRLAPPCSYSPFPMRLYTKWDISSEALELQRKGVGMGGGREGDCNLTRSGLGWRECGRQAAKEELKGGRARAPAGEALWEEITSFIPFQELQTGWHACGLLGLV